MTVVETNGIQLNGIQLNGIQLNGIQLNGIQLNGVQLNGIQLNGIQLNGIQLNGAQLEEFTEVLAYMVECALPHGQEIVLDDANGEPLTLAGAIGLAPEWYDGPLSDHGEACVSACLASRSNSLGQSVLISMEGCGITRAEHERDIFTTHEGIFWGNLLSDEPYIEACFVDGGGLSGRVCAESDGCGFEVLGDCANVCEFDPTVGAYTSCGNGEQRLINTWLNLSHRSTFGQTNATRLKDGAVVTWGSNEYGQNAVDVAEQAYTATPTVIRALGDDNAESVIHHHACARKRNGDLWCWGRNESGQVGDGTTHSVEPYAHPTPAFVASNIAQVSIGKFHTCAIKTNGEAQCWGRNNKGQLGIDDSNIEFADRPRTVFGLSSGVLRMSAGSTTSRHSCAVMSDGTVKCWGNNEDGQIGDGSYDDRYGPVRVDVDERGNAFTEVTDVCASKHLTCARKADGSAWCWGGEIGASFHTSRPRRYPLGGDLGVAPGGIACGTESACIAATDGTVWCMGGNRWDQLGYDTGGGDAPNFQQVPGVDAISFVNAGRSHTCAMRVDGSMWCWGTDPGEFESQPRMFSPRLTQNARQINIVAAQ